jgi:hypothetical protein
VAIGAGVVVAGLALFGACGGCRSPKDASAPDARPSASSSAAAGEAEEADASAPRTSLLWISATDGDVEDLATLAAHEGAAGLVEAASETSRRATAIQAMGYAHGWAQLPFLAKTAGSKDDREAMLALESVTELAIRPRLAEDPEDIDELREGCDGLLSLARDAAQARKRRIAAVRALRMMPCPPITPPAELPTDLDAK